MKIFLTAFLIIYALHGSFSYADESRQCIAAADESEKLREDQKKDLESCVRKRNCSIETRSSVCPWALDLKASLALNDRPDEDKKAIEEICVQCESLAVISCGQQMALANEQFLRLSDAFTSDKNAGKPLMAGFLSPNSKVNNMGLEANLQPLLKRSTEFNTALSQLTAKFAKLSQNVKNENDVRKNLNTLRSAAQSFSSTWGTFFRDSKQLAVIAADLDSYLSGWQDRMLYLKRQPGCKSFAAETSKAEADGADFLRSVSSLSFTLSALRSEDRMTMAIAFGETAIKKSYLDVSKGDLKELETALESTLSVADAFLGTVDWWNELSFGGFLLGGRHTVYHQYAEPMKNLLLAFEKSEDYRKKISSMPAVTPEIVKELQRRSNRIQKDIDWLGKLGWQGQLKGQLEEIDLWVDATDNKNSVCVKAMTDYKKIAADVHESYERYATIEPAFASALLACEAGI